MKAIKHTLASVDIHEFQYDDMETLDDFLQEIKSNKHSTIKSGDKTFQDSLVVYADKGLVPFYNEKLFDWIQKCVDEVAAEYFGDLKFVINDTWVHKADFGASSLKLHVHIRSVLSGLLYLTDHPDTKRGRTVYYHEDPVTKNYFCLSPDGAVTKTFTSKPKKGKLLIWPSFIQHKVEPTDDMKKARYTLSFNTWPDGVLGNYPTGGLICKVETARDRWLKAKNNIDNSPQ